ncbi:MAG: hypothetical protein KA354_21045 [Phycisphaerae bacterium]|nr:hypothetical protein [Phycisphaerae bacterium]
MRRNPLFLLGLAALLCMGNGCPISISPDTTSVRLVNNTAFPVEVRLYYAAQQNILESLLEAIGTEYEATIAPGTTASFSRDCEELQAIFIENAKLVVVGDVGPSTDTDVYRDGTDFGCGDTLTFTFTQPALPTEINVSFSN